MIISQRLGPLRRTLVALLAVAGALAAPAPAGAKLLIASYNEGLEPHAVLQEHSRDIDHPRQLRLEISGLIQAEVEGRIAIKCYRHGVAKFSRAYTASGMSPAERVVNIRARWDRCRVASASARFVDPFVEGWIAIRVWGTPR